jgi:hypothetical protein
MSLGSSLTGDLHMTVGRNPVVGPCFFTALHYIFPEWPAARQKAKLIECAESSPATLSSVLSEVALANSLLSRYEYNLRQRNLRAAKKKEASSLPVSTEVSGDSEDGSTESAAPRRTSARLVQRKQTLPQPQSQPQQVVNEVDDDDDDDEDYEPSEMSDSDSPLSAASGDTDKNAKPSISKRKARRLAKRAGKADTAVVKTNKRHRSVIWGVPKQAWPTVQDVSQWLKQRGAKQLPNPQSVHVAEEKKANGHHQVVVHATAAEASSWRDAVAALNISGLKVMKWLPLKKRKPQQPATPAQPAQTPTVTPLVAAPAIAEAAAAVASTTAAPPAAAPLAAAPSVAPPAVSATEAATITLALTECVKTMREIAAALNRAPEAGRPLQLAALQYRSQTPVLVPYAYQL